MKWFKKIKSKVAPKEIPEVEEYQLKDKELEKLSASFVSPDEKYIASLGNGYIMNYLANKSAKKGFAFITDKRVYFKGSCLSGTGKHLVKTNEERTVDVKNITGSGFTYHRYYGILVALFFSVLVTLAGAISSSFFAWEKHSDESDKKFENTRSYEELLDFVGEMNSNNILFDRNGDILLVPEPENYYPGEYVDMKGWTKGNRIIIEYDTTERYLQYEMRVDEETAERIREKNKTELLHALQNEITNMKTEMAKLNLKYDLHCFLFGALGIISPILFLPIVVICCINLKKYLLSRKTLFRIEYAGGCIAFDVSFYAKAEIDDFQKQLRRAKDMAEENTEVKAVTVETPAEMSAQSNVADDLRKYAELLKEGLITQEEYDAMKKKVLGL